MKIYLLLIALFLISCSDKNAENKNVENKADTSAVAPNIANTFDEKLFKPLTFPFSIDTTFILKLDSTDRIPYEQLRSLQASILVDELSTGIPYDINTFCMIDSLKENQKYQQYIEKLDIGMTKISIAYKIGILSFKNNSKLFIWGISSSSYEACPFYSGTSVIGTFVNTEQKNTHFLLGEISAGGDPPSMANTEVTAKINADGKIEIKSKNVSDDLDIPGESTTLQTLILQLDKDKIVVLDSKKQENSTEKGTN